jgi:gamma-glutamyltranspeptidase
VNLSRDGFISLIDAYFGGVQTIAFENGRWVGAADPRRDGTAKNGMTK